MQDVHREVKQGEGDTPSCMNSVSPGRGRKGVCRGVWGSPKRKTKAGARSLGSEKEKGREEGNRK